MDNAAASFSVLQWNTLADGLAQHGEFIEAPPQALCWSSRSSLLLQELQQANADIVCLQEVNRFDDFFEPQLSQMEYQGLFLPKAASPCQQYGFPPDGCAIFFKRDRFKLMQQPKGLCFQDGSQSPCNQGLLSATLVDRVSGRTLLLVCTHFKAKEGQANELIREHQAQQLLEFVSLELAALCSGKGNGSNGSNGGGGAPHLIVCGDLNTTPDARACQALRSHPAQLASLWDYPVEGACSGAGDDAAASPLQGAAAEGEAHSVAIPFTTWKLRPGGEKRRTIDYVWYTANSLVPLQRWSMPSCTDIGPAALPSLRYGSDHLAVCAVFGQLAGGE